MSLTDVMSGFGLQLFAELGLVFFGGAFLAIVVTTFLRRNREYFERARLLPLEDDGGTLQGREVRTHE